MLILHWIILENAWAWESPTQCGILPTKQMATPSKIGAVIRVSVGNFLEMYDFMVFGYYAAAIGRAFSPRTMNTRR